jgi:hypothetical protein
MKNISFALTTEQVRYREKTVTRRLGWFDVKAGDKLQAIVKGQGLKKGEKVEKICKILVTNVRRERLDALLVDSKYGNAEVKREGFPYMPPRQFVDIFLKANRPCQQNWLVTRIEFVYVEE